MGTGKGIISHEVGEALSPEAATSMIRQLANSEDFQRGFGTYWTKAIKEALQFYGLISGDALHVFKRGVIEEEGVLSTRTGVYKYKMKAETPNSNGRIVTLVICACVRSRDLKITDLYVD